MPCELEGHESSLQNVQRSRDLLEEVLRGLVPTSGYRVLAGLGLQDNDRTQTHDHEEEPYSCMTDELAHLRFGGSPANAVSARLIGRSCSSILPVGRLRALSTT